MKYLFMKNYFCIFGMDVDKLFIITSSQKIVDKLNKKFGSSFTFNNKDFWDNRTYFLKP